MDPERLHEHYRRQAEWLAPSRHYLFRRAGISRCRRVLDLGCGSGVIADELRQVIGRPVLAADRDPAILALAREKFPGNEYRLADDGALARAGESFDLVVLSFVLMWQHRPLTFLKRIRRLLAPGGMLLALAEPDYGGRIDFPDELGFLKDLFVSHIRQCGGDPFCGRRLASLLGRAGFAAEVELASGLHFPAGYCGADWEREWRFWQDIAALPETTVRRILKLERDAAARRERLVVFPVFCALARVR